MISDEQFERIAAILALAEEDYMLERVGESPPEVDWDALRDSIFRVLRTELEMSVDVAEDI